MNHGGEIMFQEPGVVLTTLYLAVDRNSLPVHAIRSASASRIPGAAIGQAARFAGWFVMLSSCAGCVANVGFAGVGIRAWEQHARLAKRATLASC